MLKPVHGKQEIKFMIQNKRIWIL